MITYVKGSLFASPAQVLVNTVNTEGVMGKGIALKFKQIYPDMFSRYQELCEQGKIDVGVLWVYKTSHKWVLNFPTKKFWRQPSRLEYIETGLQKLKQEFNELNIHSIAFPALGCGNGELEWETVRPIMEFHLKGLPANIFVHPPQTESEFPEHRNQAEITKWLRSEPRTLPFSEVWRDLKLALARNSRYTTSQQAFSAEIVEDLYDQFLLIRTNSRPVRIGYEELREIWSSFRLAGYLRRGFVTSSVEKKLSYIMPVLAELPYVEPVSLGEMMGKPSYATGLQYVVSREASRQPTLF